MARSATSGGMAPVSTIIVLFVPSAASCQTAQAACVWASRESDESIATSGPTPPTFTIELLLSPVRARSASTAAARSCGVFTFTRRPSPSSTTSGSMALAAVIALRFSSERAASTASASAAFICAVALRCESTATSCFTAVLREATSCEARWSSAATAFSCVSTDSEASRLTSGAMAPALAIAIWFSACSRARRRARGYRRVLDGWRLIARDGH